MDHFLDQLKWKLKNLNGFWDYFWLLCVVLNTMGVITSLSSGNIAGLALNGLFLYACLRGLIGR